MSLFKTASEFSREKFAGRVQKIPVDAGFTCPNRDGRLSHDGCIYCSNQSFSPFYSSAKASISEQLKTGSAFYAQKYNCQRFFAYFQSFTGTYAPIDTLREKYLEALRFPGVEGLVIATRPDCIDKSVIELLDDISQNCYIRVELGIESFENQVLAAINRHHDDKAIFTALNLLKMAKIDTCAHLIFGLPGESLNVAELAAQKLSGSGAILVKMHHLQVIAGTELASKTATGSSEIKLHSLESYLETVVRFIAHLSPQVYLERFINRVPARFLIAPKWGNVSEADFHKLLQQKLLEMNLRQGVKFGTWC